MLGPMGAVVMSALRVMTPSEIDRHAEKSGHGKIQPAAAGAEGFIPMNPDSYAGRGDRGQKSASSGKGSEGAKIIPIRGFSEQTTQEEEEQEALVSKNELKKGRAGSREEAQEKRAASSSNIQGGAPSPKTSEAKRESAEPIFLLKEREKLKKIQNQMNGSEALKSYAQSSKKELVHPESGSEEREKAQGSRGILINRKHY